MSIFQFILAYNFDRPEKEIVRDLIYRSNEYRVETPSVEFGSVEVLDPRPEIEDDPNSFIRAVVRPSYDYRLIPRETGFLYTRIPLAAIRTVDDIIIQPLAIPFTAHQILPEINRQLGLRLTEDDIEDTEYVTMDDDFVIHAKPQSKVWLGWRYIQVLGGGKKFLLFPNYLLFGFPSAPNIQADKLAQLTAIANHDNHTLWKHVLDFDFGNIDANMVGAAGRNTRIKILAHRQDYIDQWVYYTRIRPSTINDQFVDGVAPPVMIPRDPFTIYQLLDKINETLNLHLTADDVFNDAFLPGLASYPLRFKPTSVAWIGDTYALKVSYLTGERTRLVGGNVFRTIGGGMPRLYG